MAQTAREIGLNALVTILSVVAGWSIHYVFIASSPLVYVNEPFPVLELEMRAGQTVQTYVRRCNNSSKTLNVILHRRLVSVDGSYSVELPSSDIEILPGCTSRLSTQIQLPVDAPPQFYFVEGKSVVKGWIKDDHVSWTTVLFQVTQ